MYCKNQCISITYWYHEKVIKSHDVRKIKIILQGWLYGCEDIVSFKQPLNSVANLEKSISLILSGSEE